MGKTIKREFACLEVEKNFCFTDKVCTVTRAEKCMKTKSK